MAHVKRRIKRLTNRLRHFFCHYILKLYTYVLMHIYGIENKIFKTVADQAANMKKALSDERESTQIQGGANEDNLTKLIIERNRKLESLE